MKLSIVSYDTGQEMNKTKEHFKCKNKRLNFSCFKHQVLNSIKFACNKHFICSFGNSKASGKPIT